MYLMMVFAVVIFVIGRVPITRELVITGTPARVFGILLFLLCAPALAAIDYLISLVLPSTIRSSLGVEVLRWVLLGAVVFASAWALYAKLHAALVPDPEGPLNVAHHDRAAGGGAEPPPTARVRTDRSASEPRTYRLD